MNKRKIIISIAGVILLIAGFFLSGVFAGRERPAPKNGESKNAKTVVRTQKVENGPVQSSIKITGRVVPAERIQLFAEVGGIATYGRTPFKTGNAFTKGSILLKIDDTEFKRALTASKSQFMSTLARAMPDIKLDYSNEYKSWRQYLVSFDLEKAIIPLPEVKNEQLKLFLTGRDIYPLYYQILEDEERLNKHVIRAPFNGTLTETNINQSSLVRVGQELGEFSKDGHYELEASVVYDHLRHLNRGLKVSFSNVNSNESFTGELIRINDKVDPESQLVKVYFEIIDGSLKSGLYLEGRLAAASYQDAIRLPIQSLVDDSSIFILDNGKAELVKVRLLEQNADNLIVADLPEGSQVIIDKKNSAFAGSQVIEMQ